MPVIVLTAVLAAGFIAIGVISRGLRPKERTRRAVEPLAKLISLAPILGLVIFALLFAFVLKGRLMERASHALMVFALWMYATRFYLYILAHFKHRGILAGSMAGMLLSAALAVLLTPLDRYVSLIYSLMGWGSFIIGFALLTVFYIIALHKTQKEDLK